MKTALLVRLSIMVVIVLALFLLPHLWTWSGLPPIIIISLLVAAFFLVRWHARHFGYHCPQCDYTFAVSPLVDFMSPHLGRSKLLHCPRCGHSSWCHEIDLKDITGEPMTAPPPRVETPPGATSLRLQIFTTLAAYAALWIYTFYLWPSLPVSVSAWTVLKIPLVTLILPVLQVTFCLFALRHGYRSRIYIAVSLFVIIFLLLAIWMQRNIMASLT